MRAETMTGGPVEALVRALRSAADGLADLALWIKLWSKGEEYNG
ncbi:MAG: hypothetical protein SOZ14_04315 [Candidatus Pseudoscilispira sp.]|nr:hypothetical protein [Candidatus Pseudoscilispira sp.]